ncbi:hypothetical protein G4X40_19300 [Rhodococcus sp. D2-41]|uniref:hypothetical protein n=1 Tax=Speluncibacter jeojiensis TaxID=2710754 RepID=UPI003852C806|nr:hypothetical protein [Rhodococcus sp. D2-41]
MTDAQTLDAPPAATPTNRARRWTPGDCVWCGDSESVQMLRNEPRCATCREKEGVIDEARKFLGMYGLRPLGGTLQSDDDEERQWRIDARDARTELNQMRLPEPPDPALVRKMIRPRAATVVAETASRHTTSTTSSRAGTAAAKRAPAQPMSTDAPDLAALEERVTALLAQLTSVEGQIQAAEAAQGLAARARLKDLTAQRSTILRTLAALEKARRSAAQ